MPAWQIANHAGNRLIQILRVSATTGSPVENATDFRSLASAL